MAKTEGEAGPEHMWKQHYKETHIVHIKLDFIAKRLGISFLPQDSAAKIMQVDKGRKDGPVSTPPNQENDV